MKSEMISELAKALIKVQAELKPVPRGSENPFFKSRYAELSACIKHATPLLAKHGLAVVQIGQDTKTEESYGLANLQTLLIHESGQWISGSMTVTPTKADPQGYGSALTYLRRYGFMAIIGLAQEGDDDDAEAASHHNDGKGEKHRPTRAYEDETVQGDAKATSDLLELSKWLKENNIPEGFVLAMLREKKLVSPQLKLLGNAPPGVIHRTLTSRERLLKAFQDSSAGASDETVAAEVRVVTREGDQTGMEVREPVDAGLDPHDLLEQEGYENWRHVVIHFGKKKGAQLGKLPAKSLVWWITEWHPEQYKGNWNEKDLLLDAALCLAHQEMQQVEERNKQL
jgi:hypothetical protein